MRGEIELPDVIETALVEAERRFGLTREEVLTVCVVAGVSELTDGYVREILKQIHGEEGGRS